MTNNHTDNSDPQYAVQHADQEHVISREIQLFVDLETRCGELKGLGEILIP
jgi:hypothetical protein